MIYNVFGHDMRHVKHVDMLYLEILPRAIQVWKWHISEN